MEDLGFYTIGALSSRAGVKIETVRYYERVGLLSPTTRSEGGHRLYEDDGVYRLNFIRRCRELGFPLTDIREMLSMVDAKNVSCAEFQELAQRRLDDVRARISDLRRMERTLSDTLAECEGGSSSPCPIIDSLYPRADQNWQLDRDWTPFVGGKH